VSLNAACYALLGGVAGLRLGPLISVMLFALARYDFRTQLSTFLKLENLISDRYLTPHLTKVEYRAFFFGGGGGVVFFFLI
jgi:hypothetical protein